MMSIAEVVDSTRSTLVKESEGKHKKIHTPDKPDIMVYQEKRKKEKKPEKIGHIIGILLVEHKTTR